METCGGDPSRDSRSFVRHMGENVGDDLRTAQSPTSFPQAARLLFRVLIMSSDVLCSHCGVYLSQRTAVAHFKANWRADADIWLFTENNMPPKPTSELHPYEYLPPLYWKDVIICNDMDVDRDSLPLVRFLLTFALWLKFLCSPLSILLMHRNLNHQTPA
jgi:hypothetical protein